MSFESEGLANVMAAYAVVLMTTFANVIISFIMGMAIFIQLRFVAELARVPSEMIAVLVAMATYLYIWYQPKIRNYVSTRSK